MKKIFGLIVFVVVSLNMFIGSAVIAAPSFEQNFAKYLKTSNGTQNETVFNLGIDKNKTLRENIISLFYPDATNGGKIWDMIRVVGVGILLIYLFFIGWEMMKSANKEAELSKAKDAFIYVMYGSVLFFGTTWILGTILQIGNLSGTVALANTIQNSLFVQVLGFLKAAAFFIAIIMIVYYGYEMIRAVEKSEMVSSARKGIVNVIMALLFIKIIDFIFFIAQQTNFKSQAMSFIVSASKIAGYIVGILMILTIFYGGFQMVTSQGDEEKFKKAQNIILTVFITALIIFLFLLITYQIINEFTG